MRDKDDSKRSFGPGRYGGGVFLEMSRLEGLAQLQEWQSRATLLLMEGNGCSVEGRLSDVFEEPFFESDTCRFQLSSGIIAVHLRQGRYFHKNGSGLLIERYGQFTGVSPMPDTDLPDKSFSEALLIEFPDGKTIGLFKIASAVASERNS